ncbi:hypothetical protein ZWY2020_017180 [Hordeum vulgare]|nr:hypothetical protein ZWY2020_017180 [Hordeum vulgare]
MDNPSMVADGGVSCACVLGKEEGLSSSEPKFRSPNPSAMDRGGRSEKSGDGCGRCCLGFLLKLLAFLQAFAALSIVLYAASILSAFILSRWARHHELHIHHLLPDLWFACAAMAAGLLYYAIFLAARRREFLAEKDGHFMVLCHGNCSVRDPFLKCRLSDTISSQLRAVQALLEGGMFGMRASDTAASWVVGWMGTDAHLYDDPEDAAILALLDSRFDAHL